MTLVRTLATVAVGAVFATSAFAQPLKLPSAGFSCAGDPSRGAVQDHDLTARARALAQRPAGHDHAQR